MDPFTITQTEQLNERILRGARLSIPQLIKQAIEAHDIRHMEDGERYYDVENDILKRKQFMYVNDQKVEDPDKPNNRIPHAWHKLLVDQKVNYLLGNPVNFIADDEVLTLKINEYLGERWDDAAIDIGTAVSNKGQEWLHPYIDENGDFDFLIIPAEQSIPIWEDEREKRLKAFIRYYEDGDTTVAEYHTETEVTFYRSFNGEFALDDLVEVNPIGHFRVYKQEETLEYGWGKVPFIRFLNNSRKKTDLQFYKQIIDAWDRRVSDNQNNFDEIQELIYILKNYEGENLGEFMRNLKQYKAINVAGDGGVETMTAETPMSSIQIHMDNLRESLFTQGQGVDVSTDKFGQSPSGVALEFLYRLLDLKASALERKWRPALQELIWFLCEYLDIKGEGRFDYRSVDFVFKKRRIRNDLETANIAQVSLGTISRKTIVSNHPWVADESQEQLRIDEEAGTMVSLGEDDE
ncbi:SPP1 family phage portal protein [Planomicrobium soli]|uniref:SPP1 family phage portal protein n=1 Tax=Planomicrobium soli TaxID=1176648 RepID=A0A2P8H7D5_9BACL|nr:phage portal protein [Planomicrobium soli]PSL42136.1 SPP1 family phage portal protein [Planomicrobium soli]